MGFWIAPFALLGIAVAARLVLAVFLGGPPPFSRGRVSLVVGRMGSGKSLWIMTRVYRHLKHGGTVASNFHVENPHERGEVIQFHGWDELARLPAGVLVVLDEVHLYAPSRQGYRLPEVAAWYMSMARKLGHEVMLATQHERRVTSSLLLQVHEIVRMQSWPGRWHRARVYDPDSMGKGNKPIYVAWLRRANKVTALFDTFELIKPDDSADGARTVRNALRSHVPDGPESDDSDGLRSA